MPTGDQYYEDEQGPVAGDGAAPPQQRQLQLSDEMGRVAVGGGTTLVGLLIGKGLGLAGNLLLSHLLGAGGFGLWSLARSVTGVGEILGAGGLPGGVGRFVALAYGERDARRLRGVVLASRRMALLSSLAIATALAGGAPWIAERLFHTAALAWPLWVLSGTIVLTVLVTIHQATCLGVQAMHYLVLTRDLLLPGGIVLVGAVVWLLGGGLQGVLLGYWAVTAVTLVLAVALAERLLRREAAGARPLPEYRRVLLFSLPLLFSALASFGANYSDRLLVGAMLGPRETGYYVAALQWSMGVTLVLSAYAQVFGPTIARLHHRQRFAELATLLKDVTAWIIALTLPVGVCVILLAQPLMQAFGPGFESGRLCLVVLVLAALFNAATGPLGVTMVMSGRPGLESLNVGLAAVLTPLLTYLLAPRYGITGAAVATGFTTVLANAMRVVEFWVLMRQHPYCAKSARALGVGVLASLGALAAWQAVPAAWGLTQALVATGVFLLLYAGLLLAAGGGRDHAQMVADLRRRLRPASGSTPTTRPPGADRPT